MTRQRAKSANQTSLGTPGTTETAGALRSPPPAYGEPRRLLSSAPFHSSSGECRIIWGMSDYVILFFHSLTAHGQRADRFSNRRPEASCTGLSDSPCKI